MTSGASRTTALLAVCALTLAGCGGNGTKANSAAIKGTPTPTTPSPTPSETAPSPSPTKTPAKSPPTPTPTLTRTPTATATPKAGALPPIISRIATTKKVVFITVDDGWEKDEDFVDLIRERHIPITVFLMNDAAKEDYGYFRRLQQAGALIEDHTMTHPLMTRLPYAAQKRQICQAAGIYAKQYGSRPTLFRSPYGASNTNTRKAAKACGMKAIFFWRETSTRGNLAYQTPGGLQPGDIILVHFNPGMTRDFTTLLHRIRKQGFQPAALRYYLPSSYF
jgi:peptidoglycan/xylan/chitin deacetylase (PgdA/CDA1 family)